MTQAQTQTTMNRKIYLAAQWYRHGAPVWDSGDQTVSIVPLINLELLGNLWRAMEEERQDHRRQAEQHATGQTRYAWSAMTVLSDDALAYEVVLAAEYERLEVAAKERRILALAAALNDGDPTQKDPRR